MKHVFKGFSALISVFLLALPSVAQEQAPLPVVLVADELFITPERILVARGNVEALQGETRVTAREIRFDQNAGALELVGPITLEDDDGTIVLASQAALDPGFKTGLLTGARLVLEQQLQLSAVHLNRANPRYDQLYKTVVTSCRICSDGGAPLWQIRAKRVIHDKEEGQLYFDQAQFRIGNMPVFYLPRLRMPDPSNKRATGFLIPSLKSTTQLGLGVKLPYFLTLGDSRDVTVTPYLSGQTRTLEFRYRQAFRKGDLTIESAVSRDDLRIAETRAYLFANAGFSLPRGYILNFDVETTSDDAYLRDYDFSDKDRLDSQISITRTRRDQFIRGSVIQYSSLRDDESSDTLPSFIIDTDLDQRFHPKRLGGEIQLSLGARSRERSSNADIVGRDLVRFNADLDWLRGVDLIGGIRADLQLGAALDHFAFEDDSTAPERLTETTPRASLTLRYPLRARTQTGATHLLEPVIQIGWSDDSDASVPNEESTRVEFDQGNLLALSRFPAPDRRERGIVGAYGLNWTRLGTEGLESALSFGQILRETSVSDFSGLSGLQGQSSDYLLAAQIRSPLGWAVTARSLFDDDLDFTKSEMRGFWGNGRSGFSASYVWLSQDPSERQFDNLSEVTLSGFHDVNRHWRAEGNWRFDLTDDRAATVGVGVIYNNECLRISFSADRRYTSSLSLEPTTTFGFTIGLRGFSTVPGASSNTRACRNASV